MVGYFSTAVWDFGTILPKNKQRKKIFDENYKIFLSQKNDKRIELCPLSLPQCNLYLELLIQFTKQQQILCSYNN